MSGAGKHVWVLPALFALADDITDAAAISAGAPLLACDVRQPGGQREALPLAPLVK